MSHGGKGSKRRPESEPGAYGDGYERIFGKGMLAGDKPLPVVGFMLDDEADKDWPESLPAYKRQHNGEVIREGFGVDADAGGAPV